MSATSGKFYCWPFGGMTTPRCGVVMPMLFARDGVDLDEADALADALLALQPADRVLVVNAADEPVFGHADDLLGINNAMSLWHPHGVARAVGQYLPFACHLAVRGVRLVGVAFDGETTPSCWQSHFDAAALVADPRYPEAARLYDLPADPWADPMRFNYGAELLAAQEFNRIADAVLRYHPAAWWSNYADVPLRRVDADRVPDVNAWTGHSAPGGAHTYSPAWYGYTAQLTKVGNAYGRGGRPFTSYERVVWSHNQVVAGLLADPTGRFCVWTSAMGDAGFSAPHAVEVAVLSLLAGRGRGLHWAGSDLTADLYAADAARLDAAAAIYDAIAGGVECVGPLSTELRSDGGYALAAASRFADGSVRGRVVWSDKAKPGRAYDVSIAKGRSLRVRRDGDEAGTSFRLEAA